MKGEKHQVLSLISLGELSDQTVDKFFSNPEILNKMIKAGFLRYTLIMIFFMKSFLQKDPAQKDPAQKDPAQNDPVEDRELKEIRGKLKEISKERLNKSEGQIESRKRGKVTCEYGAISPNTNQ